MHFTREINRLMFGILLLLGIVAVAAAYWAVVGPDTILQRQDNPRLVQTEAEIRRGSILDRDNTLLVTTTLNDDNSLTRSYIYPEFASALGYASLRYGVNGAEAAFNNILRGDTVNNDILNQLSNDLLHKAKVGSDVRLTFDLDVQQAAVSAMGDHTGAIVILDVPTGQVLAMASLPTYDPNTLDQNWEALTQAKGNPFFNRALQGTYQPGLALQTPLLAAALLANYPLNTPLADANQSVQLGEVSFSCVDEPPDTTLTLQSAYLYGCPYPFAQMIRDIGIQTVQSAFNTFAFERPPTLTGYVTNPADQTVQSSRFLFGTDNFTENALGQGTITVSPLEMAVIAAAIVNDGNAPIPHSLLQVRPPNTDVWHDEEGVNSSVPMLTADSSRQMQTIMEAAVDEGAAHAAAQPDLTIGGHVALAYVGETTQTWFIGFVTMGNRQGAAIALVLEDTSNTDLAAEIGGQVLAAAQEQLGVITPQPTAAS
ncbi:MAG: hypothetical protein LCI00_02315 [Chloroflexi bacterium]|nr:hypothetical protein [Chloroflexota bacterium]MCC6893574.1 hypothetical protein [Anaerolineae bacterium]